MVNLIQFSKSNVLQSNVEVNGVSTKTINHKFKSDSLVNFTNSSIELYALEVLRDKK